MLSPLQQLTVSPLPQEVLPTAVDDDPEEPLGLEPVEPGAAMATLRTEKKMMTLENMLIDLLEVFGWMFG